MGERRSIVALAAGVLGIAAALAAGAGALGANLRLLTPYLGFRLFAVGAVPLALTALVLGLVGVARTRTASGRSGRGLALLGSAIGAGLVLLVLALAGPSRDLPVINDVTTRPEDPPVFRVAVRELETALPYPGDEFAAQQRAAYPDIAPIELALPPEQAYGRVRQAVVAMGLEIVAEHPDAGILEAQDESGVFRFVDDLVVRIRPGGTGAVVDVRSRSRVGRGDLGANAERIRRLRDALR
jgi:uncharacterized protein (DUF1499 family)